ncbi:MAG: T9SS type A sorting domain-containing protein [candidate division WOR-3 bacterium]
MLLFLLSAWTVEIVTATTSPPDFLCPVIVLDSLENPYILVPRRRTAQTNYLLLFSKEGGMWVADTFEFNQSVLHPYSLDMAIDLDNRVTVVYTIYQPRAIIIAQKNNSGWLKDTIDTCWSSWNSIAITSSGVPHIVYQPSGLIYAFRMDSLIWQKTLVDSYIYTESGCAIDLDEQNQPHISYFKMASNMGDNLWYATRIGNQWYCIEIDTPNVPNWNATLIHHGLDNLPHIVYTPSAGMWYAYNDSVWHSEYLGSGQIYSQKSLDLDCLGQPYILSTISNLTLLTYKDFTGWHSEELPLTPTTTKGRAGSLFIGRDDIIHIARFATDSNYPPYCEIHYIYGRPEGIEERKRLKVEGKGLKLMVLPSIVRDNAQIQYTIPERQRISLDLYDIIGRKVKTIAQGCVEPGIYSYRFDSSDLSSGVYFLVLESERESRTRKLLIAR